MNNLVQCSRCRNVMIDEEYDNHDCKPEIRDSKILTCSNHYIIKDKLGRTVIGIRGFNGIHYEFVEIPEDKEHTKIPYQPIVNTNKNYRQDNSTILWVLFD